VVNARRSENALSFVVAGAHRSALERVRPVQRMMFGVLGCGTGAGWRCVADGAHAEVSDRRGLRQRLARQLDEDPDRPMRVD
jgi:hypothetical protein